MKERSTRAAAKAAHAPDNKAIRAAARKQREDVKAAARKSTRKAMFGGSAPTSSGRRGKG